MGLKDQFDFSDLKNEAEDFVLDLLSQELSGHPEICQCEDCIKDMVCLALNHVTPRYRVSLLGTLYAKNEDKPFQSIVEKAVQKAIITVGTNPSHD